jgi:hypothetical protein
MTTKAEILQAIRRNCLDCSGHRPSAVRECELDRCPLWPYRLGNDPAPGKARGCAKAVLPRTDIASEPVRLAQASSTDAQSPKSPLPRVNFEHGEALLAGAGRLAAPIGEE